MDYDPDGIVYADFFDGLTLDSVTFSYSCLIEQNMTSCGESKLLLSQGLIKGTYMVEWVITHKCVWSLGTSSPSVKVTAH